MFSKFPKVIIGGIIGLFLGIALVFLDVEPWWIPAFVLCSFLVSGLVYDLIKLKKWLVSRTEKKSGEPTSESKPGEKQEKNKIDEYHV